MWGGSGSNRRRPDYEHGSRVLPTSDRISKTRLNATCSLLSSLNLDRRTFRISWGKRGKIPQPSRARIRCPRTTCQVASPCDANAGGTSREVRPPQVSFPYPSLRVTPCLLRFRGSHRLPGLNPRQLTAWRPVRLLRPWRHECPRKARWQPTPRWLPLVLRRVDRVLLRDGPRSSSAGIRRLRVAALMRVRADIASHAAAARNTNFIDSSSLTNMTRSLQQRSQPWATTDSRATLRTE